MENRTIQLVLLVVLLVLLMLVVIVFVLFSVFMRRKNHLLGEQKEAETRFEQEIAETQIEIREETLRNISWELHDNIGQLLTLAKIKAQSVKNGSEEELNEISETIGVGLKELRALSKSISPESLKSTTLVNALELEIERYNRLRFLEATISVKGEPVDLDKKAEIIIFRIMQEFFTNTIKHSRSHTLEILIEFNSERLNITARDNGVGFNQIENDSSGIGLMNMKRRASLIKAEVIINSTPGTGTEL
ncbi:MAG: ATP-binding protein, partial [Leeuwenhoekiella sp.]